MLPPPGRGGEAEGAIRLFWILLFESGEIVENVGEKKFDLVEKYIPLDYLLLLWSITYS